MIDKPVPARTTQKPLDQLIPDSADSYAKDEEKSHQWCEFLDKYVSGKNGSALNQQTLASEHIIQMAQECHSGGGLDERQWTRDDLDKR